ncbi:MAG: peptidylprolyl isomerase [Gammaproteobacteria bacterium]|nr:MAG: peptidylprolyl isomerase [Gammaproteobacteria bacterium]
MPLKRIFLFILAFTLVAAFNVNAGPLDDYIKKNKSKDAAYATVNGVPISKKYVHGQIRNLTGKDPKLLPKERLKKLVDDLVSMEVLIQEAVRQEIHKDKKFMAQMAQLRRNAMARIVITRYSKDHPVSDADLKDLYDSNKESMEINEYKASHILLETREKAEKIIKQLNDGGDFKKLAADNSKDPSSAQGGDLGWFNLRAMVKPFSAAVSKLKKGKYTSKPVQSQFGWHVILLQDTRKVDAPSFDNIKKKLRTQVQRQRAGLYVQTLRKKAKVDMKL